MSSAMELQNFGGYTAAKEYVANTSSSTETPEEDEVVLDYYTGATIDHSETGHQNPGCRVAPIHQTSSAAWSLEYGVPNALDELSIAEFDPYQVDNIKVVFTCAGSLLAPVYSLDARGVFDKLDALAEPQAQITNSIIQFQIASMLSYKEQLIERLELLIEAMHDEGEVWSEGSADSLSKMLRFLEGVPQFQLPAITITPAATFRAQWTRGTTSHFAIEFLPDGQVHFVVFCPNPRHPSQVMRVAGKTSGDTLIREVTPYGIDRWCKHA